jgi:ABC-type proline/glycine betaine transport system permease subunit
MSYVRKILRPSEQIIVTGKLHWIIYLPAIVLVLLSFVVFSLGFHEDPKTETFAFVFAFVAVAIGVVLGIMALFKQWTTEIVVTNHRVIYKKGFIRRHTAEMNMDKV